MEFLPISKQDMIDEGIEQLDFVYVCGDAYVDHPSFGHAIITRILESHGYKIGLISQPDWKDKDSVSIYGEPRLGFLVSGGNMDFQVIEFTVGIAEIVYGLLNSCGGINPGLRFFTHSLYPLY